MKSRVDRVKEQTGAVLVEASIALLIILMVTAAILEYAGLFGSTIDVSAAARAGARAGTASTTKVVSDYEILQSIVNKPGGSRAGIEKVIVYKSTTAQQGPNPQCIAQFPPPAGLNCNAYRASDFGLSQVAMSSAAGAKGWPEAARVPGQDYLGVYIQVARAPMMNLVWSPERYSDHFAMRIEPLVGSASSTGNSTGDASFSNGTTYMPPSSGELRCWMGGCSDDAGWQGGTISKPDDYGEDST